MAWEQKLQDEPSSDNVPIIIAQKEEPAREIFKELDFRNDIYYLSENLKNEIDSFMMLNYPDEYETHVLNGRKEELDAVMTDKIGKMIADIDLRPDFPIFEGIEFETINRCNGGCSFCPVNKYDDPRPIKK